MSEPYRSADANGAPSPGSSPASPPSPAEGRGARARKPPRWVIAFLRALERTGEARAAAEAAGVDHSTAYARRRTHADFALAWAEALKRFRAAKARREKGEGEALMASLPTPPLP